MAYLQTLAAAVFLTKRDGKIEYDKLKYQQKVIPMIDILYFTKKLDGYLSRELEKKGLPKVFSAVEPKFITKDNHGGKQFNAIPSLIDPKSLVVSHEGIFDENNDVYDIASKEFEVNGKYLNGTYETFTEMDMLLRRFLKENPKRLDEILKNEKDGESCAFEKFYKRFGIEVKPISDEDYRNVPKEVLEALYFEMIGNNNDRKNAISFDTFVSCFGKALDELENNMQYVQSPDYQSKSERENG